MKSMRWPFALSVVGVAIAASAQMLPPPFQGITAGDVAVTGPVAYYVSADGGGTECSLTQPCAKFQPVCNKLAGKQIDDDVTSTAADGWSGTGCWLEGISRGQHALPDGGVKKGTVTFTGPTTVYVPLDGGTGTGTIASVAAGNRTANANYDVWTLSGRTYGDAELANTWIGVTSGTGSGTDRLWPLLGNDAGVITLNAHGEVITPPTAGAVYTLYQAPGAIINANLGQFSRPGGPEGVGQGQAPAAFLISTLGPNSANGAADDPWVRVQHFKTSGTGVVLVRANGGVSVRENYHTATGALARGLAGVASPAVERNILTAGLPYIGRNVSFGAQTGFAQIYNNICTTGVTSGIIIAQGETVWSQSNFCPKAAIRVGGCTNCSSTVDTWDSFRVTGDTPAGAPVATGSWEFENTTLANLSGKTYPVDIYGDFTVGFDQSGGSSSVITSTAGGHSAAINLGHLLFAAGTTFDGAGTLDLIFGNAISGLLVSDLRARKWRGVLLLDGTSAFESGGLPGPWEPALVLGAPLDEQVFSSTLVGTTKTVTFAFAFAHAPTICGCNDTSGVAGACSWTGTASATTADFIGISVNGTFVGWCKAPK